MKLCLHKQRRARRHKPIKKNPRRSRLVSRRPMAFRPALAMPYRLQGASLGSDLYAAVAASLFGTTTTMNQHDADRLVGELFRG